MGGVCEVCGKDLTIKTIRIGDESFEVAERCECKIKADELQRDADVRNSIIQGLRYYSGMSKRGLDCTFGGFLSTEQNKDAKIICMDYAKNFHKLGKKKNGLMIMGTYGTGKTHLACAIANELIENQTELINKTMQDLLSEIKKSFNEFSNSSILEDYKTVPLLIIDDMGKEQSTEWSISTIYDIINGRYENYLPTIITTNFNSQKLKQELGNGSVAEALVDRLYEMCIPVIIGGGSWRVK